MSNFVEIATEIGELVQEKNAAYGSSFAKAGNFLRLLYPDGLKPDQYDDALLLVRIFDKQMRIATDRDALGESPYSDIAGYGILGVHMHHQKKESKASCPGTASAVAASQSPASQPASQTQSAGKLTIPNERKINEPEPSQQPKNFFAQLDLANASIVTAPASVNEVGHGQSNDRVMATSYDQMLLRHNNIICSACGNYDYNWAGPWLPAAYRSGLGVIALRCCSIECQSFVLQFREMPR